MINPNGKMGAGLAQSPYQQLKLKLSHVETDYMKADARLFKHERLVGELKQTIKDLCQFLEQTELKLRETYRNVNLDNKEKALKILNFQVTIIRNQLKSLNKEMTNE
jgi:hypothetical protein